MMRLIHARLLTMNDGLEYKDGFIGFSRGKITEIGDMQELRGKPEGIDVGGAYVLPGLIDAHTCLGLKEESHRYEGVDLNETSSPITPELNALDGFSFLDYAIAYALRGGVTSVVIAPGKANLIGGQAAAVKLGIGSNAGRVIKNPCAIKFSLGEEQKAAYGKKGKAPVTRMAQAAMLRSFLSKAREQMSDAKCEDEAAKSVFPLLRGEIPAYIHADRADDIYNAVEICREFGMKCVIVNGSDSYLLPEEIKSVGGAVIAGPLVLTNGSFEDRNMGIGLPEKLDRAGVDFCITTDHHMSPIEFLAVSGALSMREGLSERRALESVTISAARISGISDRVGSLEPGKDADVAVFSKHPFDYRTVVEKLFIDGEEVI